MYTYFTGSTATIVHGCLLVHLGVQVSQTQYTPSYFKEVYRGVRCGSDVAYILHQYMYNINNTVTDTESYSSLHCAYSIIQCIVKCNALSTHTEKMY